MVVFVEYVLIDNLIIDYLMLKATFNLTGITINKRRLFLCAFFGAIVSLVYPLLSSLVVLESLLKIFSGLLMVLLASSYKSLKSYYINAVIFFCFTFLTGGAILGVFSLFNIEPSGEVSVALMVIPVYLILKGLTQVVQYFFSRSTVATFTYKVKVKAFDKTTTLRGFLDTGNNLFDGDNPVVVCDKRVFMSILGDNIAKAKLKRLEIITASGKSRNFCFELDQLILYIDDKENKFNNVTLCLSNKNCGEDFDLILHPQLLGVDYANKTDVGVKKTC